VRHGETDWNTSGRLQGCEDIELNESGRAQALQLAGYFKQETWDLIISSPLKRAIESARIIGSILSNYDIIINEQLRERNYGKASGLLPEERRSRFPDGLYPDQEEFEHLRERAMKALTDIVAENRGRRIIIVSHGAWINSVLYTLSEGAYGSFSTRLKNGCINRLTCSDHQWSVLFYNKTPQEL
jgi:uncharacterized phosphatase